MDYESMTPNDLRREADRRELISRRNNIRNIMNAREEIAKTIVNIPRDVVVAAKAKPTLIRVLDDFVKMNKELSVPTNGDIWMLSDNRDDSWWREGISNDDGVSHGESIMFQYETKRLRLWE